MSELDEHELHHDDTDSDCIELVIESRPRDLGGFSVRRTLPSPRRRLVGPFIFFDHMGPVEFPVGQGFDVRPHLHIALATITYLFDGEFVHRDSVGSIQTICAGDVNWMVAGSGIAHSERTSPEVRARGGHMHGLQTWVALPTKNEDMPPHFEHHPAATIPVVTQPGVELRIIAGTAYGKTAPTGVCSPTLYVHATLDAGATLHVDEEHEQRAVYIVDGEVGIYERAFAAGTMVILKPGAHVDVRASAATNLVLIGGARLDGPRHIWWNFVSSSQERIDHAKADWKNGKFAKVAGDDVEFIPLPE